MNVSGSTSDSAIAGHAGAVRLEALDGLRGIAALIVMLHHVFFHFSPWPYAPGLLGPVLHWVGRWGWTLVDLFFLLSGFVFAHVYIPGSVLTTPRGRADFMIARIARLYPLHLALLVLFALIQPDNPLNTAAAFAAQVAMLQAFIPNTVASYNGAAWSLSVEAACYAIFVMAAAGGLRLLVATAALFAAIGAVLLACVGATDDSVIFDLVPRGLLGFFAGQLLWHARLWLQRLPSWLLLAGLAVGITVQVSFVIMPVLPLALLAWPALLLLALRCRWLGGRALVWLGDRSYAIYMVNLAVITVVIANFGIGPSPLSASMRAMVMLGMVAATVALADLSYRWLERPARQAIRGCESALGQLLR